MQPSRSAGKCAVNAGMQQRLGIAAQLASGVGGQQPRRGAVHRAARVAEEELQLASENIQQMLHVKVSNELRKIFGLNMFEDF